MWSTGTHSLLHVVCGLATSRPAVHSSGNSAGVAGGVHDDGAPDEEEEEDGNDGSAGARRRATLKAKGAKTAELASQTRGVIASMIHPKGEKHMSEALSKQLLELEGTQLVDLLSQARAPMVFQMRGKYAEVSEMLQLLGPSLARPIERFAVAQGE